MKIYHIEFAKLGTELSGGENCMLKLIENFSLKGYENILLTTDNAKNTYERYLPKDINNKYFIINSYASETKYGPFVSYFLRIYKIIKLLKKIKFEDDDVIICHSEFYPNSIGNWIANKKNKKMKQFAFYHMKAPSIFRGYEGEYTGRWQFPRLTIIHYQLNQWIYRKLTSSKSTILTVNNYYKDFLKKKYSKNKIVVLESYGGIENALPPEEKIYDLIWVGRFHRQKGINDFFKIVAEILKFKPDLKVALLGGANKKMTKEVKGRIESNGLSKTIKYAGFVTGEEKNKYYARSKIFMMTSYYESFGQVILEAMSHGLPVVAYYLPVYDVFKNSLIRIKVLDYKFYSKKTLEVLKNKSIYEKYKNLSYDESIKHSWNLTADKILKKVTQND